jgi:hypothetical protein
VSFYAARLGGPLQFVVERVRRWWSAGLAVQQRADQVAGEAVVTEFDGQIRRHPVAVTMRIERDVVSLRPCP